MEPHEEFDRFDDLLLGRMDRTTRRRASGCHDADPPEVVPGGEVLHRLPHLVGEIVELRIDPLLEQRQMGATLGEQPWC